MRDLVLPFSSTKKCSSGDWYVRLLVWEGKTESSWVIFHLLFSRGLLQKVCSVKAGYEHRQKVSSTCRLRFDVPEPPTLNLNCHLNKIANWFKCILKSEIHFFFQTILYLFCVVILNVIYLPQTADGSM